MVGRLAWLVVVLAALSLSACELELVDSEYAADDADPVILRFRLDSFDPKNLTDVGGQFEFAGSLYLAQGYNGASNAAVNVQIPAVDSEGHRNKRLAFWHKVDVPEKPGELKLEWKYDVRKSEYDALVARAQGEMTTDAEPHLMFSAWESDDTWIDSSIGWGDTFVGSLALGIEEMKDPKKLNYVGFGKVTYAGLTVDSWHRYTMRYEDSGTGSSFEPNGHLLIATVESPAAPGTTTPTPAPGQAPGQTPAAPPTPPGPRSPDPIVPGPSPSPPAGPADQAQPAADSGGGCSTGGTGFGWLALCLGFAFIRRASRRGSAREEAQRR